MKKMKRAHGKKNSEGGEGGGVTAPHCHSGLDLESSIFSGFPNSRSDKSELVGNDREWRMRFLDFARNDK